jgi:hypothetical protein
VDVPAIFSELDDHGFEDTGNTRKLAILQDTVYDVCSREPWPFLEQTASVAISSGNAVITLPSDFRAALALVIPSVGVLTPERLDTVTKSYLAQSAPTGQPFLYYFVGESMRVFPTPDANYTTTLMYLRVHPVLTATSAESEILVPVRHHRVLVLGCLAKLYAMEDDTELSAVFMQQYEQRLQLMEADLWKKQYDRPERVVDIWDNGGGWW